jgi:hypothetical protein
MHQSPEQFEKLTTLLKLKRYEVPPPGYFHRFSSQVIARIEVLSERQPSWLKRFWSAFEARPSVAATCGVALGALLVTGFVLTQHQPDDALPWEAAGSRALGRGASSFNPDPVGTTTLGLIQPQTGSNALTPVMFMPVNHW